MPDCKTAMLQAHLDYPQLERAGCMRRRLPDYKETK